MPDIYTGSRFVSSEVGVKGFEPPNTWIPFSLAKVGDRLSSSNANNITDRILSQQRLIDYYVNKGTIVTPDTIIVLYKRGFWKGEEVITFLVEVEILSEAPVRL